MIVKVARYRSPLMTRYCSPLRGRNCACFAKQGDVVIVPERSEWDTVRRRCDHREGF